MSTWKNVGMTYLKYADLCATHVRNALKEPAKTKAMAKSDMHARVMQWTNGKRGTPGKLRTIIRKRRPPACDDVSCPPALSARRPSVALMTRCLLRASHGCHFKWSCGALFSHGCPAPPTGARRDRHEEVGDSRVVAHTTDCATMR